MNGREKPILKQILDLIEKNGPTDIDDVMAKFRLSKNAAYKACYNAHHAGYLSLERIKVTSGKGRKKCVYTRTDKVYVYWEVLPKTTKDRERRQKELEMSEARREEKRQRAAFIPFRDPLVALFFGPWTQPVEPSPIKPRLIERW